MKDKGSLVPTKTNAVTTSKPFIHMNTLTAPFKILYTETLCLLPASLRQPIGKSGTQEANGGVEAGMQKKEKKKKLSQYKH